jgi:hypothetical protein
MKHFRLGGSNAKTWLHCTAMPEYVLELKKAGAIAEEEQSPFAEEGGAAHSLLEICLKNRIPPDEYFMKKLNGFVVDEEMVRTVSVHYDRIISLLCQFKKHEIYVEKRFDLTPYVKYPCGGTADIILYLPEERHLFVDDYKHGCGFTVEIHDNPQPIFYALGACRELREKNRMVETVDLTIVQPRIPHIDGPIRTVNTTASEIIKWGRKILRPTVKKIIEGDTKFHADADGCFFCPANGVCPEFSKHNKNILKMEFMPDIQMLTQEESEEIAKAEKAIIEWIKKVKLNLFNAIKSGQHKSDFFALTKSYSNRKYRISEKRVARKMKKLGLSESDIYEDRKLRSPAQMEKKLTKKLGGKKSKNVIDSIAEREEKGYKMVDKSKSSNCIESTAIEDFRNTHQETNKSRN